MGKEGIKKALIFGITGQDGSYLAEFLLSKASLVLRLSLRHLLKCDIKFRADSSL